MKYFMFLSMKKIIKIVFGLVCIVVLGFAGLVGYATFSDYKPDPAAVVFEKQDAGAIPEQKSYKLLIWNIGYGGLSRDMDFSSVERRVGKEGAAMWRYRWFPCH